MKDYSKRLVLIVFLGLALMFVCTMMRSQTPDLQEQQQPPPQEQALQTFYRLPAPQPAPIEFGAPLLFTDSIDWAKMTENGIGTVVMLAVFLLVVSPLVKNAVSSGEKLAKAIEGLSTVINDRNKELLKQILDSEKSLKEDIEQRFCYLETKVLTAIQNIRA